MLTATPTPLPGLLLLQPKVFRDERGFFTESWNQARLDEVLGEPARFVQDNHSRSGRGVLRGLHYQVGTPQAKLVRVVAGRVFDVAVDLRRHSPTFGQWAGYELSADNGLQLWIPAGFAHGYLVLGDSADFLYKTTAYHAPAMERGLAWNDPLVDIRWPLDGPPTVSAKDAAAPGWDTCEKFD